MHRPWHRDPLPGPSVSPTADERLEGMVHRAFSPPVEALARVRAEVMADFTTTSPPSPVHRDRSWFAVGGAALAALVLMVGAAVAGSAPGGPFYEWRLGLESSAFPAVGTSGRYDAEIRYLDARFAEFTAAVAAGRSDAAAAAGSAYRSTLADLTSMTTMSKVEADRLSADLVQQSTALASLSSSGSRTDRPIHPFGDGFGRDRRGRPRRWRVGSRAWRRRDRSRHLLRRAGRRERVSDPGPDEPPESRRRAEQIRRRGAVATGTGMVGVVRLTALGASGRPMETGR